MSGTDERTLPDGKKHRRQHAEGGGQHDKKSVFQDGAGAADHIGLRMVMSMVDEAAYINALGLNNLTLEITA